jgi:ABC-2 type transport system permease protein
MPQLKNVWFIAMKDLKLFFRDRFAFLFATLFPFLFATMFYFLMGGVGAQDSRLVLHLATLEAPGGLSYQILESLEKPAGTELAPGQPEIVWDRDYDQAYRAVTDNKLAGFIAFPADFTQVVTTGGSTTLDVVVNAQSTNTLAALNGLAGEIAARVSLDKVAADATVDVLVQQALAAGKTPDAAQIQQAVTGFYANQADAATSPIAIDVQKVGEVEAENPSNWVIPGYLVMFVFFTAALGAEAIVRERKNQTLERLLAGSVRREAILGGIFSGIAIKGLIQIGVFWIVGSLVFKIDMGLSPAAVIILSVLMVLMSSAFAVMLATLGRSERGTGAIAVVSSLALAPLGGCWWPLFITPRWMQFLAQVTPHGWATTGFNKLMLFGGDFASVVPNMLMLLVFTVVFGALAVWRFRTNAT